jgi:hypothetical protein
MWWYWLDGCYNLWYVLDTAVTLNLSSNLV